MNTVALFIALSVAALCAGAALGWLLRGRLADRRLRRKQAFFGLPDNAESLLVVNRDPGAGPELTVVRHDAFALLELAGVVKECNAHAQLVAHDAAQQSFGERTEFCVGGPGANRRLAAHLHSLLPGVRINTEPDAGPDRGAYQIGSERYRMEPGTEEYVLLARLTAGQGRAARPVFLFCGQRAITNQAATRYLARNHEKLARKYDGGSFVLLLKVVNSAAYGADVVELVGDVTKAAQSAPPVKPLQTQPKHRAGS
ncbi:hypothetical protein [Streptomyces abyssomicinicus]|uniref:hypothetical protein n=1 Tax=Streptomyces abyssomicinicus TaxID=574929 RepID=UPI001250771F|nr:hypothetical protein [Streptomyces abyssomicinicus]